MISAHVIDLTCFRNIRIRPAVAIVNLYAKRYVGFITSMEFFITTNALPHTIVTSKSPADASSFTVLSFIFPFVASISISPSRLFKTSYPRPATAPRCKTRDFAINSEITSRNASWLNCYQKYRAAAFAEGFFLHPCIHFP